MYWMKTPFAADKRRYKWSRLGREAATKLRPCFRKNSSLSKLRGFASVFTNKLHYTFDFFETSLVAFIKLSYAIKVSHLVSFVHRFPWL
jgi:hypothetical protein